MADAHPRWREFKFTLYRIFRNPSALIGFALLLAFVAVGQRHVNSMLRIERANVLAEMRGDRKRALGLEDRAGAPRRSQASSRRARILRVDSSCASRSIRTARASR